MLRQSSRFHSAWTASGTPKDWKRVQTSVGFRLGCLIVSSRLVGGLSRRSPGSDRSTGGGPSSRSRPGRQTRPRPGTGPARAGTGSAAWPARPGGASVRRRWFGERDQLAIGCKDLMGDADRDCAVGHLEHRAVPGLPRPDPGVTGLERDPPARSDRIPHASQDRADLMAGQSRPHGQRTGRLRVARRPHGRGAAGLVRVVPARRVTRSAGTPRPGPDADGPPGVRNAGRAAASGRPGSGAGAHRVIDQFHGSAGAVRAGRVGQRGRPRRCAARRRSPRCR
jgi:hypothetical protein